ncbi:hypothetical protein KKC44_05080 [Patescibacteria group bacterium]|nr:hypothetical protein [Patescibacteria group bacterium]MBU2259948.1 hypothetical protein [Patescibacteria group bacterium]
MNPQNESPDHKPAPDSPNEVGKGETERKQQDESLSERFQSAESLPQLFRVARTIVNETIDTNIEINVQLERLGDKGKEIREAVRSNNFDSLDAHDTELYELALSFAARKNEMIADAVRSGLQESNLGKELTPTERTVLEGFLDMTPAVDKMYIEWRKQLYPPKLLKELSDSDDPESVLKDAHLDDPYAVVLEEDDKYVPVPYARAFPEETSQMITNIDAMIRKLSAGQDDDTDRTSMLEYLKAMKEALNVQDSTQEDGEWTSVKLWKEVDRKWMQCKGRLQCIHGIETGYEGAAEPSGLKVIPELKLVIRDNMSPEADPLMYTMQQESAQSLHSVLGPDRKEAQQSLKAYERSHVGTYDVIIGGGNSLDNIGVAQVGPNYEDVMMEYGTKSFISSRDLLESEKMRDAVTASITGSDTTEQQLQHIPDDAALDHYVTEFIAGHEIGHMYLSDMNTEHMEEAKATWTAMVALWQRVKDGKVPQEVAQQIMKAQIKYCLRYLADREADDYRKEGIMNTKLFLRTGLLKPPQDGASNYEVDVAKIPEAYEAMQDLWLQMTDSYTAARDAGEDSPENERHTELLEGLIEEDDTIRDLTDRAEQGYKEYCLAEKQ